MNSQEIQEQKREIDSLRQQLEQANIKNQMEIAKAHEAQLSNHQMVVRI